MDQIDSPGLQLTRIALGGQNNIWTIPHSHCAPDRAVPSRAEPSRERGRVERDIPLAPVEWAQRFRGEFAIDIETCPDCGGSRVISSGSGNICSWPRLCENVKSENPSGKLPSIYYILRLENGFQWSMQVLTRPVMQRYPTCEKIQIVFTQPRPKAEINGPGFGPHLSSAFG